MDWTESTIEALNEKIFALKTEVAKVIFGQEQVVHEVLIAMLSGGHVLLEGVPGLAKTKLIKAIASAVQLDFNRIQFTPDLMPSDIIGTELLQSDADGKRSFVFNKGPIFSQLLLADEINRTPPKTQAALLQAMEERSISYMGKHYPLPDPFFVLATQNPIEQSGTFQLPEAQLDRFLLKINMGYPSEDNEFKVLAQKSGFSSLLEDSSVEKVMNATDLINTRKLVQEVFIDDSLITSINKFIRSSRPSLTHVQEVKKYIDWGAGPRAGQSIVIAAKANALLNNRLSVIPEDIQRVIEPVIRHRILFNFEAESDGFSITDFIRLTFADK